MRAEKGLRRSGEWDRAQCRHGAAVGWATYGGHGRMDQNFGREQLGVLRRQAPVAKVRFRLVGLEAAEGGEVGLLLLELEQHRHGLVIELIPKERNRRY